MSAVARSATFPAARVAERRAALLPLERSISALDRALLPEVERSGLDLLAALASREARTREELVALERNLDTLAWRIGRAHAAIHRARAARPRTFAVPTPHDGIFPTLRSVPIPVHALVARRLGAFRPVLAVPGPGLAEARFMAGRIPLALGVRGCAYQAAFDRKVQPTVSGVLRAPVSSCLAPMDVQPRSVLRDLARAVGVIREVDVGDERFSAIFSVSGDRDVARALLGRYLRGALVRLAASGLSSLRVNDGVVDVEWSQPFGGAFEETLPHAVLATVLDIASHFH